jgi:hypothetical protein
MAEESCPLRPCRNRAVSESNISLSFMLTSSVASMEKNGDTERFSGVAVSNLYGIWHQSILRNV